MDGKLLEGRPLAGAAIGCRNSVDVVEVVLLRFTMLWNGTGIGIGAIAAAAVGALLLVVGEECSRGISLLKLGDLMALLPGVRPVEVVAVEKDMALRPCSGFRSVPATSSQLQRLCMLMPSPPLKPRKEAEVHRSCKRSDPHCRALLGGAAAMPSKSSSSSLLTDPPAKQASPKPNPMSHSSASAGPETSISLEGLLRGLRTHRVWP